jgi:UDP-N-acetylmuramoyl-tripeptide--D-alanyl-D-alanine ligase
MNAALDWLASVPGPGRRAVVLGDMLELGAGSEALHRALGRRVAELDPDLAVFAGRESRAASEECSTRLGNRCRWTKSPEEAARFLRQWIQPGDLVLVKGSRGMHMEVVVEALLGAGGANAR